MELCQRLGAEVHQRRHSEVQCQPDHPEVRHQDDRQDQGCHRSCLRRGRVQAQGQLQERIQTPLRDGDAERPDDPAYANAYFINANSATAPGIVDADLNPVLTRSEVYSGVYGRASITLYAFNSNGNRGIACGLNNLQLIRAGEPLGGKASAESDFATDDDEDFLN